MRILSFAAATISALGLKGNANAVAALILALRDANAEVRSQAAWALGLKGDARAVEPLRKA
jgi:HEAT repeat protein